MRIASAAWMSAALATWIALITLTPVRRAVSAQNEGPSSPLSWTIVSPASSTAAATSSSSGLTKTPTTSHLRLNAAEIATASAGSQKRGLSR